MRLPRWLALTPLVFIASGCNQNGDTINVVNQDCGLIRSDLLGAYTFSFSPVTADLFNCSDPLFNNQTVTVTSVPIGYANVQIFASAFNTGFTFTDTASPQTLFGNAEIDSCAMSFSIFDNEGFYLNCFGTLDRSSGVVRAACDSAAVLQLPLTDPVVVLADCDVDPILQVTLTIQ